MIVSICQEKSWNNKTSILSHHPTTVTAGKLFSLFLSQRNNWGKFLFFFVSLVLLQRKIK